MNTITIDISKSQVAMLARKGATLVDQVGNSYAVNAMTFSNHKSHENSNYG